MARTEYYYLFASVDDEKSVRLDYPKQMIDTFIDYWNEGLPMKNICQKLKIKQVEFGMIALDLNYHGKIRNRKYGIHGGELEG